MPDDETKLPKFWIAQATADRAATSSCCSNCDVEVSIEHGPVWTRFFRDSPLAVVVCHRCGYTSRLLTPKALVAKVGERAKGPLPPGLASLAEQVEPIILTEEPESKA